MIQSFNMPTQVCPHCNAKMDMATQADGEDRPREGDITVCFYCAGVSVFTAEFALLKPSEEHLKTLDQETLDLILNVQEKIKASYK